jgi:hypothetical protein
LRPQSRPTNRFRFGDQTVTTKVNMMVPRTATVPAIDVTTAMHEATRARSVPLNLLEEALFEPEEVS